MPSRHRAFEWDRDKADSNALRHGITFVDAAAVLADSEADTFHMEIPDLRFDDEERWITIASSPRRRSLVLSIVWTMRGRVTRVISARRATAQERNAYEQRHS